VIARSVWNDQEKKLRKSDKKESEYSEIKAFAWKERKAGVDQCHRRRCEKKSNRKVSSLQ